MRLPRYDGNGTVDIRRVRRYLHRYVRYWRITGSFCGWPDTPIHGAARSPAELVRKFRRDIRKTQRQHNWLQRRK